MAIERPEKDKHLGIRINAEMHAKLHYIAEYEGRSMTGQILYLIRKCIAQFESEQGTIPFKKDQS